MIRSTNHSHCPLRLPVAPLLLIFLLALSACGDPASSRDTGPVVSKTIVPHATDGGHEHGENGDASGNQEGDQVPKVPIAATDALLYLANVNLDLDKTDEQILVLKDRSDTAAPIRIAIVDYDEIRDSHVKTWEHDTQATNPRALRIETEDIVGDYSIEIICRGLNDQAELTLDIFRKTTSPSGLGLYYAPICRLSSDRRIRIDREKRSQAYQLGQKYGQSFPIVVERKDPESENNLDIIQETYHWKYQEKRYVKTHEEKIPGDSLMQQQLRELFSGSSTESDFEEFLRGPWFKQNEINHVVFFNPEYETINFYDGNVLEIYIIEDIIRHGYRLSLITRNNSISSIKKWIIITISSHDTMEIASSKAQYKTIVESEQWEGTYSRLTADLLETFLQTHGSTVRINDSLELSGIYRNNDGFEIAFEPPHFTWIDDENGGASGGFSIMSDVPLVNGFYLEREIADRVSVITFRFLKESGIPVEDRTYVLEHSVKEESNTIVKTIVLTPADLIVSGATLTSKESVSLEQIEIVE